MPTIHDKVQHVIVVMLENRSFDNMLGWTFNPAEMPPGDEASPVLAVDPDHSHVGAMWQLLGGPEPPTIPPPAPTSPLTMSGFATSYGRQGGDGPLVLHGFHREQVPVLSQLASDFAVCTRWFSSLPGQTWPNRNFAHAATSDGEVDIVVRLYSNRTIFQQIEDAGGTWRVYHQGPAQIWCFPALWPRPFKNRFDDHEDLLNDIRNNELPQYAFVEPDHGLIFRDALDSSNSQHPANNTKDDRDFLAGERLVLSIYDALTRNPAVFAKTLLVVTYDENGGFADHVPPPAATPPDGKGHQRFGFNLFGVRVPTVLVSPWIPVDTIDGTTYDHSSIPRSLRELFAPTARPLTARDASAPSFLGNLSLDAPRVLPPPAAPLAPFAPTALPSAALSARVLSHSSELAAPPRSLDDFQQSLVELSGMVDQGLRAERAAGRAATAGVATARPVAAAAAAAAPPVRAFVTEAERQLYLQDVTRRLQRSTTSG